MTYDFDLISQLTKKAVKAKARTLPHIEFKSTKSDGWVVFINGNRTTSYGRYATAQLAALIQGAAPWQLDAQPAIGEPVMVHSYPGLSGLQTLGYNEYVAYLGTF